jgi:CubicO group peptidase (beta-lactamase class C family)
MVAAVVRGNDTLLFKAYGRADVEWDVPMPADAMFEIGSVTKQFTAAAILQLRDRGKLSIEDDITKWLPDFDTRGNRVPLRRLLDHTSGIVGLTEMPEFDILGLEYNPTFPRDSAYALIQRYPFQFSTGTAQIYNNSAFWLLGLVVEKASGMTYEDYLKTQLFQPLGMSRSMYCSTEIVPRRAHGYSIQNGGVRPAHNNPYTLTFASGAICSTMGDLVAWLQALHGGKVLSPQSYAEMTSPSRLEDGTPLSYGLGMQLNTDVRGRRFMGISGGVDGFRAEVGWYPDAQMAVVVLVNSRDLNPSAVANQLMAEVLPGTAPALAQFTGDAAPLLGRYQGPSRGRDMLVEVTQTPEGIALSVNGSPPRPVTWVEGWTFRQGSATILNFRRSGESGPATELRYSSPGAHYVLKRQ